jgi:hypothetical protein
MLKKNSNQGRLFAFMLLHVVLLFADAPRAEAEESRGAAGRGGGSGNEPGAFINRLREIYGGFTEFGEGPYKLASGPFLKVLLPFRTEEHSFMLYATESNDGKSRMLNLTLVKRHRPAKYHLDWIADVEHIIRMEAGDPPIRREFNNQDCNRFVNGVPLDVLAEMIEEARERRWVPFDQRPELKLFREDSNASASHEDRSDDLPAAPPSDETAGKSQPSSATFLDEMYKRYGAMSDYLVFQREEERLRQIHLLLPVHTDRFSFIIGVMEAERGRWKTAQILLVERMNIPRLDRAAFLSWNLRHGRPMIARRFINAECLQLMDGICVSTIQGMIAEAEERRWEAD